MNRHTYTIYRLELYTFKIKRADFTFVYATMMSIGLIYNTVFKKIDRHHKRMAKTAWSPLLMATTRAWAHVTHCNHSAPACEEDASQWMNLEDQN